MTKRLKKFGIGTIVFFFAAFAGYFLFTLKIDLQSPFSTSVMSAFCGTFAAALMVWLIEHQRTKIKFRRDCNLALARLYSNLYSLINFKRMYLLPLNAEVERIQKIYNDFFDTLKSKEGSEKIDANTFPKINTNQLIKRISNPGINFSIPVADLVTDHVNSHQMVLLAEQATVILIELGELCAKWEKTLADYAQSSMSERAKLAVFFGVYPSSTGYEGHIKGLIHEICLQTEAALAFLDILAEKIRTHAIETQGTDSKILKIELTNDFRQLMPPRDALKHWKDFQ